MGTYLFANDATTPIGSMTVVPTTLSDGAVGDTTTGPTEASDAQAQGGDPCVASFETEAVQRIVWDGGSLHDITAVSVTGRCRTDADLPFAACIDPPGATVSDNSSILDYSPDGISWTTLRTDVPANGSFVTYAHAAPFAARYVRRTLITSTIYSFQTTPFGSAYAYAWNTDFRITGTPAITIEPPLPPEPEEEGNPVSCTILLTWNDVEGAALYDLQRRRPSGEWDTIYTGAVSEYEDSGVESGQQYYYQARAKNGDIVSEWSGTTVVESACGSDWTISPLPEQPTTERDCSPEPRTWGRR